VYPKTVKNYPTNAIKVSALTTLIGSTIFAFEQGKSKFTSVEYGLGYIGLGFNSGEFNNRRGLLARFGFKYYFKPFDPVKRYVHAPLNGFYFRPELSATYYHGDEKYVGFEGGTTSSYNILITQRDRRYEKYGIALLLNFGHQLLFQDRFCVDLFFGVGAGYGKQILIKEKVSEYYVSRYEYFGMDQIYHDESFGTGLLLPHQDKITFAGQLGLKVGYLFYDSKKQKK
jgi:hypothetical protein